jgi:hypothetical protein
MGVRRAGVVSTERIAGEVRMGVTQPPLGNLLKFAAASSLQCVTRGACEHVGTGVTSWCCCSSCCLQHCRRQQQQQQAKLHNQQH